MDEPELRYRGKAKSEVTESENVCDQTNDNNGKEDKDQSDLRKSFWLTRIVFLRGLAFIYFVAFSVSFNQNKELIGDNGLLPAKLYLSRIKENQKELSTLGRFF